MYKQPPIWIINSTLFIFFICMLIFVGLTRYKLPARTSLVANYIQSTPLKDVSKIDISRIYRNDLFNTYKDIPAQEEKVEEKKLRASNPTSSSSARARSTTTSTISRATFCDAKRNYVFI